MLVDGLGLVLTRAVFKIMPALTRRATKSTRRALYNAPGAWSLR